MRIVVEKGDILACMRETMSIVFPVFALIAVGFAVARMHVAHPKWVEVLNGFAYYVALPALVIRALLALSWDTYTVTALALTTGILLVASAIVIGVLWLLRIPRSAWFASFALIIIGNTIYMGVPILTAAYPDAVVLASAIGTVQLVVGIILAMAFAAFLQGGRHHYRAVFIQLLKGPLTLACIVGIFLSVVPAARIALQPFDAILAMLAATASPLALFALGAFFARQKRLHVWPKVIIPVIVRVAVAPLAVLWACTYVGIDAEISALMTLASAMPTAVTAFVLSQQYRLATDEVATGIMLSTVISLVTLPLFLMML